MEESEKIKLVWLANNLADLVELICNGYGKEIGNPYTLTEENSTKLRGLIIEASVICGDIIDEDVEEI